MTSRELTTIHTGIDFGEGPRWHDGRLWFSDFYRHGVFTLDADGTEKDCDYDQDRWNQMDVGSRWEGRKRILLDSLICSGLVPEGTSR